MSDLPPNEFSDQASDLATPVPKRPTGIIVIAVISLLLGATGLFSALMGLAGPLFGSFFQEQIIAQAENDPENEALQLQAEIQRQTQQVARKYMVANLVIQLVTFFVCLALIVGAILLLRTSPLGRKLMMTAFLIAIVCDIGKSVVTYVMQSETMDVMGEAMPSAFAADAELDEQNAQQAEQIMGTAMQIGKIVILVFMFGWLLLKIGFYVWSWLYLSKPETQALFHPQATTS